MHHARFPTAAALLLAVVAACNRSGPTTADGCDATIEVPDGFCATLVTDAVGRGRHIAVRSNGDIIVARLGSRRDSGGVSVIRGGTVESFGSTPVHGLAMASDSTIYVSTRHEVLRYRFKGDSLAPRKGVDTIVAGLPGGAVPSNTILLEADGSLLVGIPALRASCDARRPCPDLATTAGIWRFDTGKRNQALKDGTRIATGLRAPIAMAINPRDTLIYVVTHGPDSLHERRPEIDPVIAATHPGDEMIRISNFRADYGWPYCYYDVIAGVRVLSPEYGGDGKSVTGCDRLNRPLMSFPAHWEPMAMLFSRGNKLPGKYRSGAFVAFHGSSHRAPLPEDGYAVAFVPFVDGVPSMEFEVFADGFAGAMKSATGARSRPSGLAQGPDGSLYVSDDKGGRIWRITYKGK
jgi:glucose/arabinose dehydrogenase